MAPIYLLARGRVSGFAGLQDELSAQTESLNQLPGKLDQMIEQLAAQNSKLQTQIDETQETGEAALAENAKLREQIAVLVEKLRNKWAPSLRRK